MHSIYKRYACTFRIQCRCPVCHYHKLFNQFFCLSPVTLRNIYAYSVFIKHKSQFRTLYFKLSTLFRLRFEKLRQFLCLKYLLIHFPVFLFYFITGFSLYYLIDFRINSPHFRLNDTLFKSVIYQFRLFVKCHNCRKCQLFRACIQRTAPV